MVSIIAYQKSSNAHSTFILVTPDGCPELCTLEGVTYVSIPDGTVLPPQPEQIAASISIVTPDATLKSAIMAASPHCAMIDEQMREKIRAAYPLEEELKYARIGVGAAMGMYSPTSDEVQGMTVFGEFVEGVRQWGRDERAKLGL